MSSARTGDRGPARCRGPQGSWRPGSLGPPRGKPRPRGRMTSVEIPDPFNAATFFIDRNVTEGRADRVAFLHEDGAVSYGRILELVNRVGNALLELGLGRGERLLLVLQDRPEFVASFFGAIKVGAVPVPVNTLMRAKDYRYFLNDSRARVAIVSESLMGEVGPAVSDAHHLEPAVVAGGGARRGRHA